LTGVIPATFLDFLSGVMKRIPRDVYSDSAHLHDLLHQCLCINR
jgi:hypothetical protein